MKEQIQSVNPDEHFRRWEGEVSEARFPGADPDVEGELELVFKHEFNGDPDQWVQDYVNGDLSPDSVRPGDHGLPELDGDSEDKVVVPASSAFRFVERGSIDGHKIGLMVGLNEVPEEGFDLRVGHNTHRVGSPTGQYLLNLIYKSS